MVSLGQGQTGAIGACLFRIKRMIFGIPTFDTIPTRAFQLSSMNGSVVDESSNVVGLNGPSGII